MVGGFGDSENYKFEGLLGKGSFGEVYEATERKTGEKVAIKVVTRSKLKSRGARARLANEYKIHSTVEHPNIVALKNSFQSSKKVFFVMEVCKQGELADLLKKKDRFAEGEARGYFRQLVEGVSYLHSRWIIHRDIKLANLLLTDDGILKLADFGLAAQLDCQDSERLTMCGTPNYLSPEIAKREPYTLATDVWSLGVVLYTMLCGTPPFQEDEVAETIERVKNVDFECPDFLSPEASDIIQGILHKDKSKRLKLKDIQQHPFCTGMFPQGNISESPCEEKTPRKCLPSSLSSTPTSGMEEFTPPNRVLRSIQPSQSPVFRQEHLQSPVKKCDPTQAIAWGTPTEGSPYQPGMFSPPSISPEPMDSTVEIGVTVGFRSSQNMVETQVGVRGGFGGNEFSMDVENCPPEQFSFSALSPIQVLGNPPKVNTHENRGFCQGKECFVSPDRYQPSGILTSHSPHCKTSPRSSVIIDLTEIPSPRCKETGGERVGCINGGGYGSPQGSTINHVNLVVTASPTGDKLRSFSETVMFGVQGGCPGGYQMVGNMSCSEGYTPESDCRQLDKDPAVVWDSHQSVYQQEQANQGDSDRGGEQENGHLGGEPCLLEPGGFSLHEEFRQNMDFKRKMGSDRFTPRSSVGDFTDGCDESEGYGEGIVNYCKAQDVIPGSPLGHGSVRYYQIGEGSYVSPGEYPPCGDADADGEKCQFYGEADDPGHKDGIDSEFDPLCSQAFSIQSQGVGQSSPVEAGQEFSNENTRCGLYGGETELRGSAEMGVEPLISHQGVSSSSEGEILPHGGASFGPWINQKNIVNLETYIQGLVGDIEPGGTSMHRDPAIMKMLYGALVGSCTAGEHECSDDLALHGGDSGLGRVQVKGSHEESKARLDRLRGRYAAWLPPERIKRLLLESGMHVEDPYLTDPEFLGDFACEESEKLPEEFTGRVVTLPELPPLDPGGVENVESLARVVIDSYSDRDLAIVMKDMSLGERDFLPKPEGRLGFQQSPNHDLQFWHLGQHFSGESAHRMRDTLEHLVGEGHPSVMHGAGPYSSHVPYQDLDMRMCQPSSKDYSKLICTHRLPHSYAWAPPHSGFQGRVQLLPNKHLCMTMENDGKDTRFLIDPTGIEVCIEREPKVGEESPEPILKYSFPELPNCAMEAYQAACDFVRGIANGVLKIQYTAYYGVGKMYENGCLSLALDENHKRELGVSGLDLVDLPDECRIQVNHVDGVSHQIPIQGGEGVDGSRYSILESFVERLTQNELRAIELAILCKGSCEDVCEQALGAERKGQRVSWPLKGVDRIDAS